MAALRTGDEAPDFSAQSHDGRTISLRDYRGRTLVLYFFPRAFTPGCTIETKSFRDRAAEIAALGAEIVGVSMDEPQTQREFAECHAVPFALIGDPGGDLCKAYGVVRRFFKAPKRVTYVVDPEGRIAARFEHELRFTRHVDEVLQLLRARRPPPPSP
jgi:peroxiredoxin